MACLEMYNSDQHKPHCPPISPRISFSNDFADSSQHIQEIRNNSSSVSSDFEFSVSNYSMMTADELFFKGRLLPYKHNSNQTQRTIRDELLAGDDDDDHHDNGVSLRTPKCATSGSSNRWKGLLGLKRTQLGSKKIDNNGSSAESRFKSAHDDPLHVANNNSQEFLNANEGGSSHRDVEIGI